MDRAKTRRIVRYTAILALTLAAAPLASTSHAANFTWDGQISSSWGGSRNHGSVIVPEIYSNWNPDGSSSLQLPTSNDRVIFGDYITSRRTVNLNGTRSAKSLEFKSSQDFTLTNGTLLLASGDLTSTSYYTQTLDADITLQSSGTWNVSWAPVIVNGRLYGSANLTKNGVGPLYLTNSDNLLRNTYINEGSFKILDGGSLTNTDGYIGNLAGTLGTAYVTGANSTWTNTAGIHVGSQGRGTLGITQGGTVTSGYGFIGESTGSSGTVTVYGPDSTWNSGGLSIGKWGQGVLNIRGGSSVTSSSISVGVQANAAGTITVADANSTLNTSSMVIGHYGKGTLNIQNGGSVLSDGPVDIGFLGTSTNIATVSGANSTWDITSGLRVGYWSSGTLKIEDGGTVSSLDGVMGGIEVDFGADIVTVAGPNSAWNNSDTLTVGISSYVSDVSTYRAILNIETGGTVSAGNKVRLRNGGNINLLGGTLRTASFDFSSGKAINFEAGTLHLTQNTSIDSSNISKLDVKKLISGQTLRVDGTTTLQTPLTLINGGKFSTDSIVGFNNLDLQLGTFELTHSDFSIGSTGLAGPNVNLPYGAFIDVTNNASIAADGVLNLNGGSFSASKLTNQGTIIANSGGLDLFQFDLVHNGVEIRTTAGSKSYFSGSVSGSGDFTGPGTVYFTADYSPGNSAGIVNFESDLRINSSGSLNIELAGLLPGEFDQLVIAGDATFYGDLAVDLLDGFMLSPNNEFEIIDVAGTLTGQFSGLGEGDLVGNFGGEDLFISYAAGDGNDVALFTTGIAGDFDSDNDVDGSDFLSLQRGIGAIYNGNDLDVWNANFGTLNNPRLAAIATAVPEPSAGILLLLGIVALFSRRAAIVK